MRVFDNSRSIFSFEIFGLTLFNKRLKDIRIAKKYKRDIIRHQIKPLLLKFILVIKNRCTKIVSKLMAVCTIVIRLLLKHDRHPIFIKQENLHKLR